MNKYNAYVMNIKIMIIFLLAVFMTSACVSTTQVVLLPNPDGKVGSLEVASVKGTDPQTLDKPWQATETSALTGAPGTRRSWMKRRSRQFLDKPWQPGHCRL